VAERVKRRLYGDRVITISWSSFNYHRGGATWGNSLHTPHKGHFCKLYKTDEKILGV